MPLEGLRLLADGRRLEGRQQDTDRWAFDVSQLRTGHHRGRLESPAAALSEVEFEVRRGMEEDDLGL